MPAQSVDVEAVLTDLVSQNPQRLNWRTSIVDLIKLLNLDSSLQARKTLAQELHYSSDMNDSTTMNVWLHKQVMQKLAKNGGKVPDDFRTPNKTWNGGARVLFRGVWPSLLSPMNCGW